jgi:predicted nuclease with TOPRIM domain
LTFEGFFTNLSPRKVEIMEDSSLENLEAGVDRLLEAFGKLKAENRDLREKLAGLESNKALFRERLDSLIERLDRSVA